MSESSSRTEQLADYQRQYRELAAQLADIGFIATGTVIQRSTRCGTWRASRFPDCGPNKVRSGKDEGNWRRNTRNSHPSFVRK